MDDATSEGPTKPLYPLQRPWLVGLLVFASFGVYALFYYYVYARDLKRLGHDVKPWAWPFVEIFPLAAPTATSRLTKHYQAVAQNPDPKAPERGALLGIGLLLAFVATLISLLFPAVQTLIAFGISVVEGVIFTVLTRDINRHKSTLPQSWFSKSAYSLTASTVIWLCFFIPVSIIFYASDGFEDLPDAARESVPTDKPWQHSSGKFTVTGYPGWAFVDVGTHSDGTADAEFEHTDASWVIIFDQQDGDAPAELGDFRRKEFLKTYAEGSCSETRRLKDASLTRISELICEDSTGGIIDINISTRIDDGEGQVEVYAESTALGSEDREEVLARLDEFIKGVSIPSATPDQ